MHMQYKCICSTNAVAVKRIYGGIIILTIANTGQYPKLGNQLDKNNIQKEEKPVACIRLSFKSVKIYIFKTCTFR